MSSIMKLRRAKSSRWRIATVSAVAAVVGVLGLGAAPSAAANTPSDWSHTLPNTSITIGWTQDHAWVIATYSDVIAYGGAFVAGQLCGAMSGEPGYSGITTACAQAVRPLLYDLTEGHPALTDHGVWVAYYTWPYHATEGTW